jgi:hypothetical protein
VGLVRTDVSGECNASIIIVTNIGEIGTTLTELATDSSYEGKKKAFFIVTAVKTSNLT